MALLRHLEGRVHEGKSLHYLFITPLLAFSQLQNIPPFQTYPQLPLTLLLFLYHFKPEQVALHLHACGERLTVSSKLSRPIISYCNVVLTALRKIPSVHGTGL
jgi:hypothetical protein